MSYILFISNGSGVWGEVALVCYPPRKRATENTEQRLLELAEEMAVVDPDCEGGFLISHDSAAALQGHIPGEIHADVQDRSRAKRFIRAYENACAADVDRSSVTEFETSSSEVGTACSDDKP